MISILIEILLSDGVKMTKDSPKICLVTGASSGIGKEIAIGLAKSGARVILVCRHLERGQQALADIKALSGSKAIDLLIADLSSKTSIQLLVKTIYKNYSTLDVLVNNAGVVLRKKKYSSDGIEMTLATNYTGPFLLTNLLLDLLEKGAPSRIINISSAIHTWAKLDINDLQYEKRHYQFMRAYAQSKLLLNMFSFELAQRVNSRGIMVNSIHPGAVKTHLGSESSHHIGLKFIDRVIKFFFITPKQAAKNILPLALSPDFDNVTGGYFVKGKAIKASNLSYNAILSGKVWEKTEDLMDLKSA